MSDLVSGSYSMPGSQGEDDLSSDSVQKGFAGWVPGGVWGVCLRGGGLCSLWGRMAALSSQRGTPTGCGRSFSS